ncbi:MAG TPA: M56 family metallopeptidase, partial [Thermoanaerobaculia bacterium]|nr:M56 family metallopeptidase [Thermoanaerobaculia bacterium]
MSVLSAFSPFGDLTAAGAVALLIKVTLVLGAAWALAALLRRRTAAARHDVWTSALLAVVVLVALGRLAPAIELPWIPARGADDAIAAARQPDGARSAGTALERRAATTVDPAKSTETGSPSATDAISAVPSSRATDATAVERDARARAGSLSTFAAALAAADGAMVWAGALWVAGIVAVLLWCLAGHLGLRRLARGATPLGGAEWAALLADAAARTGVRRPVELRVSTTVGTPVTWGAWRPLVVLPAAASSWPVERRRAALLHELAHVARYDYLAQLGGTLACALYWFHPAAWMAVRRLRLESERACDDRVLASGASPEEYAAQLLEVARGAGALRTAGAALAIGMARPSTLEGRLLAVLDESVPRRTTTPGGRLAAGLVAAIVLVP